MVAEPVASVDVQDVQELIRAKPDPSALNSNSLGSRTAGTCTAMLGDTNTSDILPAIRVVTVWVSVIVRVTTRVDPQPATTNAMTAASKHRFGLVRGRYIGAHSITCFRR